MATMMLLPPVKNPPSILGILLGLDLSYASHKRKVWEMVSCHVEAHRLYEAVTGNAIFEEDEIRHLESCEECLQMIRILVRQQLLASKSAAE